MSITLSDQVRDRLGLPRRLEATASTGRRVVTGDQPLPPATGARHPTNPPDDDDTSDDDGTGDDGTGDGDGTGEPAAPVRPVEPVPDPDRVEGARPRPPAVARRGGTPARGLTLARAMRKVVDGVREGVDLRAALTDVIPSAGGAPDPLGRGQWLGDLTTIATANRDVITRLSTAPLTGMTIYGWRFVQGPVVAHYAGNKAAVPSGPVTTEPVSQAAQRYAVGHDLDRIFVDLGDPAFLESYFTMCARSYGELTEADAVGRLVADGDPTTAADLISGINMAAQMIATAGGTLRFVAIAPDLWGGLIGLKATDAPWLFSGAGDLPGITARVGGVEVFAERNVPSGKALACDASGATWYETPLLRAQVVNVAQGGLDVGVFGYGGLLVNEPRKTVVVTVGP